MTRWLVVLATVWTASTAASAATCDKVLKPLDAARGDAVAKAYGAVLACDKAVAAEALPAAVKHSEDVDSVAGVATVAIGGGLDDAMYGLLEMIPDYGAREEVARAIGRKCTEDPKVDAFLVSLHDALKDRGFVGWAGALRACGSDAVLTKLEQATGEPPARSFDDKYATVVDLYASKRKAEALPALEKAAVAAAGNDGPFAVIIDAMVKAVTPEGIGGKPTDADKAALVAALGRLGGSVPAEGVSKVANALVTVGAPDAAGKLLPKLYPDRVQPGGVFLYGVASVETCDEDAVVHWAVVEDPATRWSIQEDVEGATKAFKARLKCDAPKWTLQLTPEPVKAAGDVETWAETVASAAGEAKLRAEKKVTLR